MIRTLFENDGGLVLMFASITMADNLGDGDHRNGYFVTLWSLRLLEFHFHLAVFIDLEFIVDFDSFNYPAKRGALAHKSVNAILAFKVVDGDYDTKALRSVRAFLISG